MNALDGYAEFLLVDWLAQLAPHWRLALFAITGMLAGLMLDVVVRRVPAAIERAWLEELQAAEASESLSPAAPATQAPHATLQTTPIALSPAATLSGISATDLPILATDAPPPRRWQLALLTGTLSIAISWRFGPTWQSVGALGLVWTLIALAYIDHDTQLLPDILTLPLLWAGLLCNLGHWFAALPAAVIGAAAGYMSLWAMYWVYWWIRRREGMGFGDFKLYAALGAWFGWTALPQILLVACVLAIVVAGSAWLTGRLRSDQMFPFGAFLAAAGIVTLFGGDGLMLWIGGTP
ncbi:MULTISPECIES: A24 family peptidase [Pandoraea]|uniref:prepilin peptidase n=1 Tax=Pandoraea TaxID=93217 RepID=UPI001F5CECDF|nr:MULTISPECIES: A24 family peptidase [Pandoraea]MCI3207723.1 prepilin peptidase [Pandoraea sp. LA3]MDN4585752.1 prepilin peptidase [Pandoraea capi]